MASSKSLASIGSIVMTFSLRRSFLSIGLCFKRPADFSSSGVYSISRPNSAITASSSWLRLPASPTFSISLPVTLSELRSIISILTQSPSSISGCSSTCSLGIWISGEPLRIGRTKQCLCSIFSWPKRKVNAGSIIATTLPTGPRALSFSVIRTFTMSPEKAPLVCPGGINTESVFSSMSTKPKAESLTVILPCTNSFWLIL